MLCPNCKQELIEEVIDDQNILHCSNCGGTFFEVNGINRISISSAQNLILDLKLNQIFDGDKLCPKDSTTLLLFQSEENVPNNITLLHCSSCRGIFAYPNELVIFKKAQAAKIDYFKLWNIPLPSVTSVAILSILLFTSILGLTAYTFFQKQNIYSIQADEQIKNIYITTSNRYLFVSFKTVLSLKSQIIFTNNTTGDKITKVINEKPANLHILTTGDVNLLDDIYYQIVLIDKNGAETRTEIKKLDSR